MAEKDIVERLEHAMATASNDDYTTPSTTERARHVDRIMTMRDAMDEIARLRARAPEGWQADKWRCGQCGCTIFARVDEDTTAGFRPGPMVRCVSCKSVAYFPEPDGVLVTNIPSPEGWRLVPVEPTKAMVAAGQERRFPGWTWLTAESVIARWNLMLAASPEPPEGRGEPIAWLHTMTYETGQTTARVTLTPDNPFGEPGRDYSREFPVATEPLFRAAPLSPPAQGA